MIRSENCLLRQPSKWLTCNSNPFAPKFAQSHDLLLDIPITIYEYSRRVFLWIIFDTHIGYNLAEFDVAESACHLPPQLSE